jgi:glycosyltransferase involved in cell wall biosynthesis
MLLNPCSLEAFEEPSSWDAPPLLLASTDQGILEISANPHLSQYTSLASYLDNAQLLAVSRLDSKNLPMRLANAVLSRAAACNWYRTSSWTLEHQALRAIRPQPRRIIHLLWADRDWGFLDKKLPTQSLLIGTFHQPASVLESSINRPNRLKRFHGIILMCNEQRQFFLDAGVDPRRIAVIHHGVDTEFYHPPVQQAAHDRYRVLFVGNYLRDFNCLLRVCQMLVADCSIEVRIISRPHNQSMFEGLPNVTFHSGLSHEDLRREYHNASCLLMTVDDATANNAILEGMACGLPVVSQAIGGIPEYVDDRCALLTERGDIESLVNNVRRVRNDVSLCQNMGVAARKRALDLNWQHVATRTNEFYCHANHLKCVGLFQSRVSS